MLMRGYRYSLALGRRRWRQEGARARRLSHKTETEYSQDIRRMRPCGDDNQILLSRTCNLIYLLLVRRVFPPNFFPFG